MINDDPTVIDGVLGLLKTSYATHKTLPLEYRKQQLQALLKGLLEMQKEFHAALLKDLGVTEFGSVFTSILITKADIEHNIAHLQQWAKPINVTTPIVIGPARSKIIYEPLGVVLVLSSWNYPVYTSIPPLAAAIAAGNCAVLKPSELAPNSSNVLKKLIEKYLDKDCYRVVEGSVQVATQITTKPFDLIIFTGSPEKGKLVARAASYNLVPCILELGGKSPTIVDQDANLDVSTDRIVQGRYLNAGQTCVACDYILVHESIKEEFNKKLVDKIKLFFGPDAQKSQDYCKIVTQQHTERLVTLLDQNDHKGKILCGGQFDVQNRYIAPTVIENPLINSKVMTEEIFGPILPIITFKDFSQVITFINERSKPLALYYFGGNSNHKKMLEQYTSSGALSYNDAAFHLLNPYLPFGGVGGSGYSSYHGIHGFRNCSHAKPVFDKSLINMWPFSARYPPYTASRQKLMLLFFKFSSLSQQTIKHGVILIAALVSIQIARNHPKQIKELKDSVEPYLKSLFREAPSL